MLGARSFRRIPLHPSILPFLHTHAASSDRQGERCVNKQGNGCQLHGQGRTGGETHCACSFLLGMKRGERHGENIEERRSVRNSGTHKKKSLKLFRSHYFLQQWSWCRIFTVLQTGLAMLKKNKKDFHEAKTGKL